MRISISIGSDGKPSFNVEDSTTTKNTRITRKKGTSLFETPSDYTVIDIETTGLSPIPIKLTV